MDWLPVSLQGLGDIVIPGIFVALMLRYDVKNGFRTKYFQSCFGGYVLGLSATLFVMIYFNVSTRCWLDCFSMNCFPMFMVCPLDPQAAQPALLYIVPSILGCTGVHAWLRGELKQVFEYSEEVEKPEAVAGGAEESKKAQ